MFLTLKLFLKVIFFTTKLSLIAQTDYMALAAVRALFNHCGQCGDGVIVIGGDFNCTINPSIDRLRRPTEHRPKISMALNDTVNCLSLCDVWRRRNPSLQKFTWLRNNPNNPSGVSEARLDRFYIPVNIMSSVRSCDINPCSLSDHSAVSFVIKLPIHDTKGSAYWHFNNSLLEDKAYEDIVTHFWTDWRIKQRDFSDHDQSSITD